MRWMKGSGPFIILVIISFWLTIFGLFDIIFNKGWILYVFTSYALLIIIAIYLLFSGKKRKETLITPFEEFEKSLTGKLFHFKCQNCNGIFAIKKSKGDNKKNIKMTCPDCGSIGIIPTNPAFVEEEIPEKKSAKANFRCDLCGEGITIWAEGTDLFSNTQVFSCPFCGNTNTMNKF